MRNPNHPSTQAVAHIPERRRKVQGFSLIELMIVVAIMAILAAIAINNYTKYIQTSRRSDAYATLAQDQGIVERCYALTFSYANAKTGSNNCSEVASTSQEGYYSISLATTSSTYTLTATPVSTGAQANDTTCATMSVTSANIKSAANSGGSDETSTCWQN